jgi:CheY-like chemotaxis protein
MRAARETPQAKPARHQGNLEMRRPPDNLSAANAYDAGCGRGPQPENGTARCRVLVVDDNEDSADCLGMMLTITGHDTRTAHDGLEAVAAAEAFRPDVVLLDIGLPRLNGYDVCRRIREQPWGKGTVLIALTGRCEDEDRRRSKEAGFNYHLVKPVDPADLNKLLAKLRRTPA